MQLITKKMMIYSHKYKMIAMIQKNHLITKYQTIWLPVQNYNLQVK